VASTAAGMNLDLKEALRLWRCSSGVYPNQKQIFCILIRNSSRLGRRPVESQRASIPAPLPDFRTVPERWTRVQGQRHSVVHTFSLKFEPERHGMVRPPLSSRRGKEGAVGCCAPKALLTVSPPG